MRSTECSPSLACNYVYTRFGGCQNSCLVVVEWFIINIYMCIRAKGAHFGYNLWTDNVDFICYIPCDLFDCYVFNYEIMPATATVFNSGTTDIYIIQNAGVQLKSYATSHPVLKGNISVVDCIPLSSQLKTTKVSGCVECRRCMKNSRLSTNIWSITAVWSHVIAIWTVYYT